MLLSGSIIIPVETLENLQLLPSDHWPYSLAGFVMNRYPSQRLEPIAEEITPADHQILCLGGTSSNLDRLPSRLQRSKALSPDMTVRFEELAYETSYLRAELQWHKETKQILLELQNKVVDIFTSLEDALSRATACLHESEQRYLSLWDPKSGNVTGGFF